jgi:hypothetical protein
LNAADNDILQGDSKMTGERRIEISVKGKWVEVPSLNIEGKTIVIKGRWIKVAAVHDEEWLEEECQDPELCVEALKEHSSGELRADIFTFTQKVPSQSPQYAYPMDLDSIAAVRTNSYRVWWEGLPQESRKNVRRSQKRGVTISSREFDSDLIQGIVGINNDARIKQGRLNDHYGKSLDQVIRDQESFCDRSEFICAQVGNEMIGYLKLVYRGDVAAILNLSCKASHFDKRPSNALLAKAIELCEARGISHLTYGRFNYGNKRNSPLREFKIRNGFEEMLMPRFYIPLTTWGAICVRLKLYRGLVGILPESVIALGVGVRSKWYTMRAASKPV